eukprot:6481414-Amphidinium_carterae.1
MMHGKDSMLHKSNTRSKRRCGRPNQSHSLWVQGAFDSGVLARQGLSAPHPHVCSLKAQVLNTTLGGVEAGCVY